MEEEVWVRVFANRKDDKGGNAAFVESARVALPVDFRAFLKEAGRQLQLTEEPKYAFTMQGGEVECTEEVFHDDILFISCGEPFDPSAASAFSTMLSTATNPANNKASVVVDRQKEYRKHEATILQLQPLFPSLALSELLTVVMQCSGDLERSIDYLLVSTTTNTKQETEASILPEEKVVNRRTGEEKGEEKDDDDDGGVQQVQAILPQANVNRIKELLAAHHGDVDLVVTLLLDDL
ncbi:hypothetical protein QOT17_011853 [Balamuthia mandrillaris]